MNMKHGMTLVEILIIVAMLGLLAAIMIPVYFDHENKENKKALAEYQLEKDFGIANSQTNVTQQVTLMKANGLRVYNIREIREYSVITTNTFEQNATKVIQYR